MALYDKRYYKKIYDESYAAIQQKWLNDYFAGNKTGFTLRINYISRFFKYFEGKDVLDLGCGVGTFSLLLARSGYNATGLDISPESVKKSEENAGNLNLKNVKYVLGDCSGKIFNDASPTLLATF